MSHDKSVDKERAVCKMEYWAAIRKNEMLEFPTTEMALKGSASEVIRGRDKYQVTLLTCGV